MTREEALEIVKASFQWRGLHEDISPTTGMLAISGDKEIYQVQRDTILRAHRIINDGAVSPESELRKAIKDHLAQTGDGVQMADRRVPRPENFLATDSNTTGKRHHRSGDDELDDPGPAAA